MAERQGNMAGEGAVIVAIEDIGTVGAVGVEAARLAMREGATSLMLLHVLDEHTVVNGMMAIGGVPAEPLAESEEQAAQLLDAAEGVIRASYAAQGRPAPPIQREIARGHVGEAVARAAKDNQAAWVVLGARRPHLFGRLTHPDVKAHLRGQHPYRLHIAPLQETATPEAGG